METPPPIGLQPKMIYDAIRIGDIIDAMTRYSRADQSTPMEWIDELAELISHIRDK